MVTVQRKSQFKIFPCVALVGVNNNNRKIIIHIWVALFAAIVVENNNAPAVSRPSESSFLALVEQKMQPNCKSFRVRPLCFSRETKK